MRETGASYPDITLLCPLARALDTNVDNLLQFRQTLTNEEINSHINTIMELCRTQGFETAEARLNALLRQYPNSTTLLFNAAMVYTNFVCFFPTAHSADHARWNTRKLALLTQVYEDKASPYWQTAAVQLAAVALQSEDLTAAEGYLKELPEQVVEPIALWVQLYQKQGNSELALATLQKRLYALVQQVQLCLASMTGLIPDPHRALALANVYAQMDNIFGLGGLHHGLMLSPLLTLGDTQAAADCFARYVNAMTADVVIPNPTIFSPTFPAQSRPTASKALRQMLLSGLEEATYKPLLTHPIAREALEKLKESL